MLRACHATSSAARNVNHGRLSALQPLPFVPRSGTASQMLMRLTFPILLLALLGGLLSDGPFAAADVSTSGAAPASSSAVPPPPSDAATNGGDSNSAKARALVDAAINMSD